MNAYFKSLALLKRFKGLVIVLFLMCFTLSILTVIEPIFFKKIIDSLISLSDGLSLKEALLGTFLVWGGVVILNISLKIVNNYLSSLISNKAYVYLWEEGFARILNLSLSFFQERKVGKIMRDFERGMDSIYMVHLQFFRTLLINFFLIIILIPLLFYLNFKMAIVIISSLPILIFIVFYANKKTNVHQRVADVKWSELSGIAYDDVSNIAAVQSFTMIRDEIRKATELNKIAYKKQNISAKWWAIVIASSGLVGLILNILVFLVGAYLFTKGELNIGDIIMFVGFSSILVNVFNSSFWIFVDSLRYQEKINFFFSIWEAESDLKEIDNPIKVKKVRGKINFSNVSFCYKNNKNEALKKITFEIKPGEIVAFVGHTGSGKTTTASLISRFYDVNNGKILIDDINIKNFKLSNLRRNIGIVFQDSMFFNTTFLENLQIGNKKATKKEIIQACKHARIWDLISKSKKGLNEVIGDRGIKLSGGEKQRLGIARAIIKDAPILILDEATSALDAKTEYEIQIALEHLIKGRTTIIIAHRLSTIKKADKIFVFEEGRIIEQGNFKELYNKKGKFYELVSHQMQNFID